MKIDTKKLRELAEAATPGVRFLDEFDGSIWAAGPTGDEVGDREIGDVNFSSADIAFTLATDPQTVITLLDTVLALVDEIERLERRYKQHTGPIEKVGAQ